MSRLKNQEGKSWRKTLESLFFMISITLAKTGGGGPGYFILKQNFTSKFLEHLNIICRHSYNLKEKTIVKKENISSFLLAKMYEIDFHQQLSARVSSTKQEQFVYS